MSKVKSIVEMYQEQARTGNPTPTEVATRDMQMFYSVMGELPNPDPILRKAGKHITVYENLLYDDQVGLCVENIEMALQSMSWEIEENGAGDDWAGICEQLINSWDNERIIGEIASARLFGYQPMELLWNTDGGSWQITDIVGKPPEWFFYNEENELRFRKMGISKGIELPKYSFITPRNKPSYKNPYGVAALSRCFWPVAFKKGGLKFWLKMVEKFGIPYVIGKQPRGSSPDATKKLLDELDSMVQDAVAVIPDDSSVDILEAGGKGASGDLFEKMVKYHDGAISKAIQGQTLTSGDGDGSGSYALGKVHQQTFDNIVTGVGKMIKRTYDEALEMYTEVNKGGPAPKFTWIEDEDVQKDRAERDKNLDAMSNFQFTGKYFKNRYNLDDDEFEIVEKKEQTPPAEFSQRMFPAWPNQSPLERGQKTKFSGVCPCGCGDDPVLHFEQEFLEEYPDQAALTDATKDTPRNKRRNQRQMREALGPVIDLIKNYESFDQAMEGMADLYPEMNSEQLEEHLARAMFVAEVWGRLSVQQEEEQDEEDE